MIFSINEYMDLFQHPTLGGNPEGFSNRELWNVIKKRLNLRSCFLDRKGDRLTPINLIKKFYESVPFDNLDYFLNIQDSVSDDELIQQFRNYTTSQLKKMPKNNELERLQIFYIQVYMFEILCAISLVSTTDTIHFSISIFYNIDYTEEVPPLVQNGRELFSMLIRKIDAVKNEHKKKSYDKLNIKLLSMKYPTIAQPIKYIVSKYL